MNWKEEVKFVKKCRRIFSHTDFSKKERERQRKFAKKYDFSYVDTWNLDTELSFYLLPRIAYLRKHCHGYPSVLCEFDDAGQTTNDKEAEKQWNCILKTIQKGLHYYLEDTVLAKPLTDKKKKVWKQAKQYIAEYYETFWD